MASTNERKIEASKRFWVEFIRRGGRMSYSAARDLAVGFDYGEQVLRMDHRDYGEGHADPWLARVGDDLVFTKAMWTWAADAFEEWFEKVYRVDRSGSHPHLS